jgi:hypothetical protein
VVEAAVKPEEEGRGESEDGYFVLESHDEVRKGSGRFS